MEYIHAIEQGHRMRLNRLDLNLLICLDALLLEKSVSRAASMRAT